MAHFQKAIESNPSVNITRGPIGLNCGSLSTIDPKDYGGRYNYALSINSYSDDITYISNYFGPVYNESKTIRILETEKAFRQFKFNYYSFKFDNNYPTSFKYKLCKENPSILHNYHSVFYSRQLNTQNYKLLEASDFQLCYGDFPTETTDITVVTTDTPTTVTTESTTAVTTETPTVVTTETPTTITTTTPIICTITCPPIQILDTASCNCVDRPICDPETTCTPTPLPANIDTTIYGYAFYLESLRNVNIPNIGDVKATCARGHRCTSTLFKPQLIKSDSSVINANRNICLDNISGGNDGSQIPIAGFTDLTGYERSDTFTFTIANSSDIVDASVSLDCQYSSCHDGVTFVVLVAINSDTSEHVVIFSSCLLPSETKVIGTIDCPTGDNPNYCDGDVPYACFKLGLDSCGEQVYICRGILPGDSPEDYVGFYLNDPSCGGGCPVPPDCTTVTTQPPPSPPTPTPTPTEPTPTPTLPPDVSGNCCFCDNIEASTFTISTNPNGQGWEFVLACGVTEFSGSGSMTVNCGGTLYEVQWFPSGNFDSNSYEIYDGIIQPI